MDGKANKEGGAFERKSLRRPQFAPGQDALLDSAPPSDSLAQAFSTNPAAIRARKAREESRAQHGPPVKGPQAPAITGRVRVVATTNAASPGVAALHNGRTGVVTKRAAGWIEVQLDATRDKPSETIPCRKRDLVKVDEAGRALETPQGPAPALKRKPKKEWAERARREAGMRGEVEEEEEEAPRVVQRAKPKKKDNIVPLTTAEKAAVLHAIAQLDGKATQKKVRRAAESALGAPEGALDEKKAAVKEVCEDEMSKQASESAPKKRKASGMSAEEALRAELKALKAENKKLKREKHKMQRTPPPNEKQIPASAVTETKLLAENARNVISLGRINEQIIVRKRFRAATANPDRCPASRRFDAERRYAWTLSEDSDFVLRPIYTIVEAPVMAMVMPYCVHGSLDLLCRRPLSYVFSLLLMTDAAKGVAHAHALGVVLRDVKPGNCLVGADGVARLADFELVRHQC